MTGRKDKLLGPDEHMLGTVRVLVVQGDILIDYGESIRWARMSPESAVIYAEKIKEAAARQLVKRGKKHLPPATAAEGS